MRRWTRTIVAALLLLLCAALLAVHLRSHFRSDYLWHNRPYHSIGLFCSGGRIHITVRSLDHMATPNPSRPPWEFYLSRPSRDLLAQLRQYQSTVKDGTLGFAYADSKDSPTRSRDLIFPVWAAELPIALVAAFLVRSAFRSHRSHRRRALGQCQNCGYDLRVTPQRCPECGVIAVRFAGIGP